MQSVGIRFSSIAKIARKEMLTFPYGQCNEILKKLSGGSGGL